MSSKDIKIKDFGKKTDKLYNLDLKNLPGLPYPYED